MQRLIAAATFLALSGCGDYPIDHAEEAVRARLKDPDSAKFSSLSECPHAPGLFVGGVNSKNSFGAYAGDSAFFVRGREVWFEDDSEVEPFLDLLTECYDLDDPALTDG